MTTAKDRADMEPRGDIETVPSAQQRVLTIPPPPLDQAAPEGGGPPPDSHVGRTQEGMEILIIEDTFQKHRVSKPFVLVSHPSPWG